MARLQRITRKRRRVPVGDLNKRVFVEDREQKAPDFAGFDAPFNFTPNKEATKIWARVQTTTGKTQFDGVGQDRRITHIVDFRKLSGISAQTWLRLATGERLDIVDTNDLDEAGEFTRALCEATGDKDKEASQT